MDKNHMTFAERVAAVERAAAALAERTYTDALRTLGGLGVSCMAMVESIRPEDSDHYLRVSLVPVCVNAATEKELRHTIGVMVGALYDMEELPVEGESIELEHTNCLVLISPMRPPTDLNRVNYFVQVKIDDSKLNAVQLREAKKLREAMAAIA